MILFQGIRNLDGNPEEIHNVLANLGHGLRMVHPKSALESARPSLTCST